MRGFFFAKNEEIELKLIKVGGKLTPFIKEPEQFLGKDVDFKGVIYRIKDLVNFSFIHVSTVNGLIQCISEGELGEAREGSAVHIWGTVKKAEIKDKFIIPRNIEIQVKRLEVLSIPEAPLPFDITKKKLNINDETLKYINMNFKSLRNPQDTFKAVYRLSIIGVIDDYEVDYRTKTIIANFSNKKDEQYLYNMKTYVSRYV